MTKLNYIFTLLILCVLVSCEKNETTSIGLEIKAITTELKSTQSIDFTYAMMGIEKIELKSDSVSKIEYDFEGPYYIDLLTGTSEPDIDYKIIEPGIYNKFEAEIPDIIDSTYSMIIKGKFTNTQLNTSSFIFQLENKFDFKIENETGIEINEGDMTKLLMTIDLQALFSMVNLNDSDISNDNKIIIDKDNNKDIYEILEDYLEDVTEIDIK